MKIVKVKYTNWQGINDEFYPERLNLLTGPNGSGKTARMRGVQFAITGKTDIGDTPATVKLISGKKGGVAIHLENGFYFERTVVKKADSSKQEITIYGKPVSVKEGESQIREQCGHFSPMFDLGGFISLSQDKQRSMLVDLCSQSTNTDVAAEALYRSYIDYLGMPFEDGNFVELCFNLSEHIHTTFPDYAKQLVLDVSSLRSMLVDLCSQSTNTDVAAEALYRSYIDYLGMPFEDGNFVELCFNLSEHIHTTFSDYAKQLVLDVSSLRIVDAIRAAKDDVNRLRTSEKTSRETVMTLTSKKSSLQAPKESVEELTAELNALRESISEAQTNVGKVQGAQASLGRLAGKIESYKAATSIPLNPVPDCTGLDNKLTDLEDEIIPVDIVRANMKLDVAKNILTYKTKAAIAAQKSLEQAESRLATDNIANAHRLNVRGSEILSEHECAAQLREVHECFTDAIKLLESYPKELADTVQRLTKEKDAALTECQKAEQAVGDAEYEYQAAIDQSAENKRIHEQIAEINKILDEAKIAKLHNNAIEKSKEDLLSSQKEYDDLKSEIGHFNIQELEQSLAGMKLRRDEIEDKIRSKRELATINHQIAELLESADDARDQQEAAVAVHKALQAIRDNSMSNIIQPVLDRMCAPYGKVNCSLVDGKGKASLSLGVHDGVREIDMSALSGGESAIYCAGLAYALVALSDCPVKCLLIQAAEVDQERIADLLSFLAQTTEVDHVFVETHLDVTHESYNHVNLAHELV